MRFFVAVLFVALIAGHPPHVQAGSAPAHFGTPPISVTGADPEGTASAVIEVEVAAYLAAEGQRIEQERLAEEARQAAIRRSVPRTTTSVGGDCAALAAELGVSEDILWRESRCRWVDNPSGCGGRGCLGPAQIDSGHFQSVSPWNPSRPGTCYGLSYAECAQRLPRSAW
jgi:hypothetical protein